VRRSRALAATLAVVTAATLSACSSESSGDHTVTPIFLADSDSGSTVNAEVGQVLEVTLHTIGPGSYEEPSTSAPVLRFLGEADPKEQNPGGPTQLYEFKAESGGVITVTIPHSVRTDVFSITVVVQ